MLVTTALNFWDDVFAGKGFAYFENSIIVERINIYL